MDFTWGTYYVSTISVNRFILTGTAILDQWSKIICGQIVNSPIIAIEAFGSFTSMTYPIQEHILLLSKNNSVRTSGGFMITPLYFWCLLWSPPYTSGAFYDHLFILLVPFMITPLYSGDFYDHPSMLLVPFMITPLYFWCLLWSPAYASGAC